MNAAARSAYLTVALLIYINWFTFFMLIDKNTDLFLLLQSFHPQFNKILNISIGVLIAIICFFNFFHKSKYKTILSKIEENSKFKNRRDNFFSIVYQIITIIALIIVFFS